MMATDMPYRPAYGARLAAGLIDLLVAAVPCFALFFAVSSTAPAGSIAPGGSVVSLGLGTSERYLMGGPAVVFTGCCVLVWLLLFGLLPAQTGATVGMTLRGLRVLGDDGAPASLSKHLVRTALWVVDGFPYVISGAVALICIVVTPTRRRIGDFVAGTVVVWADDGPPRPNI